MGRPTSTSCDTATKSKDGAEESVMNLKCDCPGREPRRCSWPRWARPGVDGCIGSTRGCEAVKPRSPTSWARLTLSFAVPEPECSNPGGQYEGSNLCEKVNRAECQRRCEERDPTD